MMNLHPEPHEPRAPQRWFVFIACGALCVVAFAAGVYFSNVMETRVYPVVDEEVVDDTEVVVDEDEDTAPVEYTATGALTIDWIAPDEQPNYPDDQAFGEAVCDEEFEGQVNNMCEQDPADMISWSYKLGTVSGGAYDGRDLVMTTAPLLGMGTYYEVYYVIRDSSGVQKPVLLDKHFRSFSWYTGMDTMTASAALGETRLARLSGYLIDTEAVIPELIVESTLVEPPPGNEFVFTGYWHRLYSDEVISLTGATTSTTLSGGGTLYLWEPKLDANGTVLEGQTEIGKNQFYLVDEDGRVLFYDLIVPFFANDVNKEGYSSQTTGVPNIRWSDGSINSATYLKGDVGGCGFTTVTHVISQEAVNGLDLQHAGVGISPGGRTELPVYEPASYEVDYYADAYNVVRFGVDDEPRFYSDFSHPYFYFQDSFGRWVEFMLNEITPAAECGKPVIYLYPEEEMDLSVWVSPRGGFSYTEPEYGDGWNVTAYPDGRLVNQSDGVSYPYLFWEGRGGLYAPPSSYWVIARSDVESFLRETLKKMNLRQNETDDFIEFWLPRMQAAPYYKIGFHGTRVMDALAPLSLSTTPDNVFRVLMDYSELQAPEPSKPSARLPRANRDGFEVIEWGGVLR